MRWQCAELRQLCTQGHHAELPVGRREGRGAPWSKPWERSVDDIGC